MTIDPSKATERASLLHLVWCRRLVIPLRGLRRPWCSRSRSSPLSILGLVLFVLTALGAAPLPEVVRIRVPSDKVGAWFPAGTEVRGLSTGEFDALFEAARAGAQRQAEQAPARLLAARHFARWNAGILTGRSELVIEAPRGRDSVELTLAPWTPAIEPADGGAGGLLRMYGDGRLAVRVGAGTVTTITLRWQLRARAGSQGRGFTLGLPETETFRLTLDLPKDWVPEGPGGIRQGPEPAAETGRMTWRFDGRGGPIDLQLHGRHTEEGAIEEPRCWVSGPTRIELGEAAAHWSMEWMVDFDPRAPRRLQVELDRGLDFASVTGPAVEESRAEVIGEHTRVTVVLNGQVTGPTPVTFQAVAQVPSEGRWPVPAARPLDAVWTGGKTSVRLDPSRILEDCDDEAGRRVPSRPAGEVADPSLLVFEAEGPRSVAVLSFGKPRADVSVEVRGQLLLGNSAPRLESQLTWRVHRGRLLALDVDLPPAWVPERVQIVGIDEPLSWHRRSLPEGGVRVHVTPPSGEFARNSLVLNLDASAAIAGGRGPLMLPRVRPVGVQVLDERWLAWTESGVTLHPAQANGLAWINPSLVIGSSNDRVDMPAGLREALAWRWIADQAEARVERERVQEEPRGSIQLITRVDRDQLRLDWRITINTGEEPLRSLPIALPEPIPGAVDWRFTDEATSAELTRKPIGAAKRAELGVPEKGEAWELAIPDSASGEVVVRSRLTVPWKGRGRLPLLVMPHRFQTRHLVIVDVARQLEASVESSGLQGLDPAVAEEAIRGKERVEPRDDPGFESFAGRRAYAFSYSKPGGWLELRTEALEPVPNPGVIEQAVLTTYLDPQGPLRHRLSLRVALAEVRTLDLTLPQGAALVRVKRDGQAITPARHEQSLALPLLVPTASRTSCTYLLDYLTPRRASAAGQDYRPERPSASLPYLAFRWEVVVPEPWRIVEHGPSLTAADPVSTQGGLSRFLPAWRTSRISTAKHDIEVLRALDSRVAETTFHEMSLGECFTRWDGGSVPLVIDRMALDSGGWGPGSRLSPPQYKRSSQGAASAVVAPLGLVLVPIGDAVLVTTRADAPDRAGGPIRDPDTRSAWEERIRQAIINGSDISDRFQVVARWRGESTRKLQYGGETIDIDPVPNGRRIWRYSAVGWPESGVKIHLVDEQRERATAWAAGLAVLGVGIACRRLPVRHRALGLAALLLGCTLEMGLTAPRPSAFAAGGAAGAMAVLFYSLGCACLRGPRWPRRESRPASDPRIRLGSGVGSGLGVWIGLVLLTGGTAVRLLAAGGSPETPNPIVALYPFQGNPDPRWQPERAVIRLEDYRRLKALAEASHEPLNPGPGLAALAATHRVSWQGAGGVVIESEIELAVEGTEPARWTFPVGKARDISASLDDVEIPVQIQPGSREARVSVAGAGRKVLRLRRFVTPRRLHDAEAISLPINTLAAARVEIRSGPAGRRIEVPNARGALASRAGGAAGNLGPADRLEVRWVLPNDQGRIPTSGSMDGLILWDAEPAGDRVRARLTYRNPEGISVVRLRLEPGVVVRSSSIPGGSDISVYATNQGIEWVAHVDPPLPDGATIRLELWRPHASRTETAESAEQTMPRIEPLGVESYSGAVAFRRPADWGGRLSAMAGSDPITEEAFVRAWGNLPDEPLTLSGVTRFLRSASVSVRTGPQPARWSVQPVVELDLGPGRVEFRLDAKLTQISGRSYHLELEVPAELHLTRVDGEGLTRWSRTGPRVQLRFDGAPAKQRTVQLQGWLPVVYDPLATGPTRQEITVPWPGWHDVEVSPGTLIIAGPTEFQLESNEGVSPTTPDLEDLGLWRVRNTYRVDRPEDLGLLRWEVEPPRVDVQVRSQLTINPDSAEWIAVLRYGVSGGAFDTIQLRLPTAWASSAQVSLSRGEHQLTSLSRGEFTHLTIRPEQPIWGSQDVTVRAVRSLADTNTLRFPSLDPTVNGTTEIDLAIVNASGREFTTEGSPGLQPVDDTSRFRTEEFSPLAGLPINVFRVKSRGWSLKVEAPGGTYLARELGSDRIRTAFTELENVGGDDGAWLGSLHCRIEDRSGPFFRFSLPSGQVPVWVALDGRPTQPLRASSGLWLIPLDGRSSGELTVIWTTNPRRFRPRLPLDSGRMLALPGLDRQRIPTFVSLRMPRGWDALSRSPLLTAVAADRQDLTRAERLGRWIADQLSAIDRSSWQDRETLVVLLVEFELLLRGAERAAAWEGAGPIPRRDAQIQSIRSRVRAARQALTEAVETAALDELLRASWVHLGLARDDTQAPSVAIPESTMAVRLRRLGQPHRFEGESEGVGAPPPLVGTSSSATWGDDQSSAIPFYWAALALPPAAWGLMRQTGRPSLTALFALLVTLAIVALSGGLWPFLAALVMAGLGWLSPESSRRAGNQG